MHAYLIITTSASQAKEWVSGKAKDAKSVVLEFPVKTVKDTETLKKSVSLSYAKPTLIYLSNIELASLPAQNALLKMIEEPQKNICFVLHTTNKEKVIETIKSRCKIEMLTHRVEATQDTTAQEFYTLNTPKRLAVISKISKRPEAKEFLEKVIRVGHTKLKNGDNVGDILEQAVMTTNAIDANANIALQLTNFVIHID